MNKLLSVLTITSLITLTACSGSVRETLGIKKHAPDEFMVLPRTNLAMPQKFTLPKPAKAHSAKSTITSSAKETLYGINGNSKNDLGHAEKSLLHKTNINKTANIREIINFEAAEEAKSRNFIDELAAPLRPLEARGILNADAEEIRLKQEKTND